MIKNSLASQIMSLNQTYGHNLAAFEDVEQLIIIEKDSTVYSIFVEFTPIIASLVLIIVLVFEVLGLLETYYRFEELLYEKEIEIQEELNRTTAELQPENIHDSNYIRYTLNSF